MITLIKIFVTGIILLLTVSISAGDIPSSRRSKNVISKQKPLLEKELQKSDLKFGSPLFIRIIKKENALELWMLKKDNYELLKTYRICYYSGILGPKQKKGDRQSPEGFYSIKPASLNPNSSYHLSFDIGYPNSYDKYYGRTGSAIAVHGNCVSIGCFAMTDKNIEEIYTLVDAAFREGQKQIQVHIFPFKMTEKNLKIFKDSRWSGFWENLKEGYDLFEQKRIPPQSEVREGKYFFGL